MRKKYRSGVVVVTCDHEGCDSVKTFLKGDVLKQAERNSLVKTLRNVFGWTCVWVQEGGKKKKTLKTFCVNHIEPEQVADVLRSGDHQQMPFAWETLIEHDDNTRTYRAPVFGGWVVKEEIIILDDDNQTKVVALSTCFVPDPNHEWDPWVEEEEETEDDD